MATKKIECTIEDISKEYFTPGVLRIRCKLNPKEIKHLVKSECKILSLEGNTLVLDCEKTGYPKELAGYYAQSFSGKKPRSEVWV